MDPFGDSGFVLACLIMGVGITADVTAVAQYILDWLGLVP